MSRFSEHVEIRDKAEETFIYSVLLQLIFSASENWSHGES